MSIKVLDPAICNLIAAGEVVERPASVVKELVENSIDAGATKIKTEISGGGAALIRVTDNGSGMTPQDARTAFLKHATSKISEREDLFNISTLGFRGEALPSIAAVSETTLLTKPRGSISGTRLVIEGGRIISQDEAACAEGSVFTVKNLFYNTPARLKFLKSERTETGVISDSFHKLALSHPEISFSLYVNGRETLFTSGNGDLRDIIFAIYGKDFADMLLPAEYEDSGIKISGYAGMPLYSKSGRNWEHFFINGRYVRSPLLQSVLENSYKNSMLISRYPVCVLFMEIDPALIDINVHPNKLSVKFSDERTVARVLSAALDSAIKKDTGITEISMPAAKTDAKRTEPVPVSQNASCGTHAVQVPTETIQKVTEYNGWTVYDVAQEPAPKKDSVQGKLSAFQGMLSESKPEAVSGLRPGTYIPTAETVRTEKEKSSSDKTVHSSAFAPVGGLGNIINFGRTVSGHDNRIKEDKRTAEAVSVRGGAEEIVLDGISKDEAVRIIGEAFSAYIIVERSDELLFIDKHALHERMLFERLRKQEIQTQTLLVPYIVSFTSGEEDVIIKNREKLKDLGFDVEDFGGGSVAVREIPQILDPEDIEPILSKYASDARFEDPDGLTDEFYHTVACKAAVKSGMNTTDEELHALVEAYMDNAHELRYCPHGRPVTFSLSRQSIEKQFKRII